MAMAMAMATGKAPLMTVRGFMGASTPPGPIAYWEMVFAADDHDERGGRGSYLIQ
jgi:hypothetical protein